MTAAPLAITHTEALPFAQYQFEIRESACGSRQWRLSFEPPAGMAAKPCDFASGFAEGAEAEAMARELRAIADRLEAHK